MDRRIPTINEDRDRILEGVRCFALDMDGTIYLGEQWIEGAKDFLNKIEETGRDYVFLTNNSSKNAKVYVEKLRRMGLSVGTDKIITSGFSSSSIIPACTNSSFSISFPSRNTFFPGKCRCR